jgi:predicted NBD/HSP70 family sugar kinase
LRRRGTASRADIARATGLSRATVSSLVADLQEEGLVSESRDGLAQPGAQGGRPGVLLTLEAPAGTAIGADFGHRHVRVALSDLSSRVLGERRRELDVDHAGAAALDLAAALIGELLAEASVDLDDVIGIGMGLPGPIERGTGAVGSSAILPSWAGLRPAAELERRLGLPVEIDNDANLGALGELTHGAGRETSDLVYIKVASGIGAGLILGGRLYRGATGIAGELGHVIVAADGAVCRCGNRGCLETVAAAPALVELLRRSYGESFTSADMLAASAAGDLGCRRVLGDAGRAIGRALADLVNCINPSLIVVGGELSAAGDPLLDGIRESVRLHALPAAAEAASITAGVLGERAALLGALALVISHTPHQSIPAPNTQ